ncbi:MAG TPA: hypothetical protein VNF74_00090, partial [Terriglobales bacterium]|nr:hypothetical protein [Terriglobales bacterium]
MRFGAAGEGMMAISRLTLGLLCGAGLAVASAQAPGPRFELSFPASAHASPITGRVFVFLSRHATPEPRLAASGYTGHSPFFATDVNQLAPGQTATVDASAEGFPVASLARLPAGDYFAQALLNVYTRFPRADGHVIWAHRDQWEGQHLSRSPGNLVSAVERIHWNPASGQAIALSMDRVLPPLPAAADTAWVKHIKIQSPMLTKFWGRPIYLGATVLLPQGYEQHPQQQYPVVYLQGHFGLGAPYGFTTTPSTPTPRQQQMHALLGQETGYQFYQSWTSPGFPRMLVVTFQHPTPYYDDSYAVNSVNDGPYGDAIMQELIPYVETHFRI